MNQQDGNGVSSAVGLIRGQAVRQQPAQAHTLDLRQAGSTARPRQSPGGHQRHSDTTTRGCTADARTLGRRPDGTTAPPLQGLARLQCRRRSKPRGCTAHLCTPGLRPDETTAPPLQGLAQLQCRSRSKPRGCTAHLRTPAGLQVPTLHHLCAIQHPPFRSCFLKRQLNGAPWTTRPYSPFRSPCGGVVFPSLSGVSNPLEFIVGSV
jgi:hypothetical protein